MNITSQNRKRVDYTLSDIFSAYFDGSDKNGKSEKNTYKTRTYDNESRRCITPEFLVENYLSCKKNNGNINVFPYACADFFALIYEYYYKSPECNFYKLKNNKTKKYDADSLRFKDLNKNIINIVENELKQTTKKILNTQPSYIFAKSSIEYIPKISNAINQILIHLFNMDEASSNIKYELVLNKLYSIIDLLNNYEDFDKKEKIIGNENSSENKPNEKVEPAEQKSEEKSYYSLLDAFLKGFDYAKTLNIGEELIKSKGQSQSLDKIIDNRLEKTITTISIPEYYDQVEAKIFSIIFAPTLTSIIDTNYNRVINNYNLQPFIEWIYKYGTEYDAQKLYTKISEITYILDEFVDSYNNLKSALINLITNIYSPEEYYKQLDRCILFWDKYSNFDIKIDKSSFLGINNMFTEESSSNGKLPEELCKQLDFKKATQTYLNILNEINKIINKNKQENVKSSLEVLDSEVENIVNMYNCYIATMGCYIVNFTFNEYRENSKNERVKYINKKEDETVKINYEFKKGLEEFCFNTWKNKITSVLDNDDRWNEACTTTKGTQQFPLKSKK